MDTILQFLISLILLIGGILLVGAAFNSPIFPGAIFIAGIVMFSLAVIIPMAVGRRGLR